MTLVQYKMCPKGLHEMTSDNIYRQYKNNVSGRTEYIKCKRCVNDRRNRWRRGEGTGIPSSEWNKPVKVVKGCPHGVAYVADCKQCKRDRDHAYRVRKRQEVTPEVIDMAKKTSLDYLKLTGEAAKASDRLNIAVDYTAARPLRCEETQWMVNEDGEGFNGYPHTDFAEGNEPSIVEARLLCGDCPVRELCFQYGKALRAKNAVYGGFLFSDKGKPVAE